MFRYNLISLQREQTSFTGFLSFFSLNDDVSIPLLSTLAFQFCVFCVCFLYNVTKISQVALRNLVIP